MIYNQSRIIMSNDILGISALIITNLGGYYGMWKYFDNRFERMSKEHDLKNAQIYERLNDHKKYVDDKFISQPMCRVMHEATSTNLAGLETRIASRFDKIEQRIEAILTRIMDKLK